MVRVTVRVISTPIIELRHIFVSDSFEQTCYHVDYYWEQHTKPAWNYIINQFPIVLGQHVNMGKNRHFAKIC